VWSTRRFGGIFHDICPFCKSGKNLKKDTYFSISNRQTENIRLFYIHQSGDDRYKTLSFEKPRHPFATLDFQPGQKNDDPKSDC